MKTQPLTRIWLGLGCFLLAWFCLSEDPGRFGIRTAKLPYTTVHYGTIFLGVWFVAPLFFGFATRLQARIFKRAQATSSHVSPTAHPGGGDT